MFPESRSHPTKVSFIKYGSFHHPKLKNPSSVDPAVQFDCEVGHSPNEVFVLLASSPHWVENHFGILFQALVDVQQNVPEEMGLWFDWEKAKLVLICPPGHPRISHQHGMPKFVQGGSTTAIHPKSVAVHQVKESVSISANAQNNLHDTLLVVIIALCKKAGGDSA